MYKTDSVQRQATLVLTEYLGVVAEFVVEDAVSQTLASLGSSPFNEEVFVRTFLTTLSLMLPTHLPQVKINHQILQAFPHLMTRPRTPVASRATVVNYSPAGKTSKSSLSSNPSTNFTK